MEWIRFAVTAVILAFAVFSFASAVIGNLRFGQVLNRFHAAGIGDALGLSAAVLAAVIGSGEVFTVLKLLLIMAFLWLTSPVSTHFLSQIEYRAGMNADGSLQDGSPETDIEEKEGHHDRT